MATMLMRLIAVSNTPRAIEDAEQKKGNVDGRRIKWPCQNNIECAWNGGVGGTQAFYCVGIVFFDALSTRAARD